MHSGQKIQHSTKRSINHLQPQPNQNNSNKQLSKHPQNLSTHFEPNKFVNDGHRQTVSSTFELQNKAIPQIKSQTKHSHSQIERQSTLNQSKILSGEQNERLSFLQNFNVAGIFASKKLYKPLVVLTEKFTSTIEKGVISVNQRHTASNTELICFKKGLKQDSDIFSVTNKIGQIQQKKQQILSELKQLYQAQQQLRTQQKLIWIQKKSQHQFTTSPKHPLTKIQSSSRRKSTSQKILPSKRQKSHSLISQFRAEKKVVQNESKRRIQKSTFTDEQKKAISLIIRRENQNKLRHNKMQQKMLEQLQSEQKQLLQKEKLNLELARSRRKERALERLKRHSNTRNSFIIRKTKIQTEPQEVENNQFFPTNINLNKAYNHSHLINSPKKNYSYINYQQLDQEKRRQQAEYFRLVLQKRKEEKKFDFGQIRVHLEKYREAKNQQELCEKEKIQHFKLQQKQHIKQIRQKYGFPTQIKQTLLEEERNSIEKYQKQLDQRINYHKKMKDYFYSIQKKPKLKSQPTFIESKSHRSISEGTFKITDKEKQRIKSNKNVHQIQEPDEQNKVGNGKEEGKKQKDLKNLQKMHNQKFFISEKLSLSNLSQDALKKRKLEINENIRKKEQQMMNLLRKDTSSLNEIKKALDIYDQLQSTNQGTTLKDKRKSKKHTVAW